MPPSTHRRQEQPPGCVCGALDPAHRISPRRASFLRATPLHASHTQSIHPCTPPAPPPIILRASHLRRARTSPWRRRGCGVCQAPPSSSRRSTPFWPQVVIPDFLNTFSSRSQRWTHQFLLYSSFWLSYYRERCASWAGPEWVSRAAVRGVRTFAWMVMFLSLVHYPTKHIQLLSTLPDTNGPVTRPQQLCSPTP